MSTRRDAIMARIKQGVDRDVLFGVRVREPRRLRRPPRTKMPVQRTVFTHDRRRTFTCACGHRSEVSYHGYIRVKNGRSVVLTCNYCRGEGIADIAG